MTDLADLADKSARKDFDSIPIIALPSVEATVAERESVAAQLRDACLNAGFFYVRGHAVPKQTIQGAFTAATDFFRQSEDVKASVDISQSTNFRGYMALLTENTNPKNKGELHEAFNIGLDPSLDVFKNGSNGEEEGGLTHSDNPWPETSIWNGAAAFRQALLRYYAAVLALGQSLFPLFALALSLPETFFDDKTQHPAAIMRILHYPGVAVEDRNDLNPGIGAHTDYECFTILAQDGISGLQVQNKAGNWIDAPFIPDTFVINIGDQFARWTNDIFVSTPHRVLPPTQTRYSIPFFFGSDHDVPLIPPSTCVSSDRPAKYPVVTAGAYVHSRLSETYNYQGDEA